MIGKVGTECVTESLYSPQSWRKPSDFCKRQGVLHRAGEGVRIEDTPSRRGGGVSWVVIPDLRQRLFIRSLTGHSGGL